MTGNNMRIETGVIEPEAGPRKDLEILDFENYPQLCGRLYIASQETQAEKIAKIINPALPVEFKFDKDTVSLDKRTYNPIFKDLSFDERQKAWGDTPYLDALKQWQTQFTEFMAERISADSELEQALEIILPDIGNRGFTPAHAEQLFNMFCNGKSDGNKSDIHAFISTVVSNLSSDGKIDSAKLEKLLPKLKWIASGLFGKDTASMITPLISLEFELKSKPNDVETTFRFITQEKRNRLEPELHEKKLLDRLYPYLSKEEKIIPAQVTIVPATDIPQPAPVTPDKKEVDEDKPPSPPPTGEVPKPKTDIVESPQLSQLSQLPQIDKDLVNMSLEDLQGLLSNMMSPFPIEQQDRLGVRMQEVTGEQLNKIPSETTGQEYRRQVFLIDITNLRKILEKEGLISAQPQPAEKPVEDMTHEERVAEINLLMRKFANERRFDIGIAVIDKTRRQMIDAGYSGSKYSSEKESEFELVIAREAYREWEENKDSAVNPVVTEAKPGSSPGQAEFDLDNQFTGTDDHFRREMELLGAKLE